MSDFPRSPFRRTLMVTLALAGVLPAQSLVDRLPREEWLVVTIGDVDAGWTHRVRQLVEADGRKLVRNFEEGAVRMARLGTTLEVFGTVTALENPDAGPVRCTVVTNLSARETTTVVEFADRKASIETTSAGRTSRASMAVPDGLLGPFGLEREIVARLGEPGAELDLRMWLPDLGQPVDVWAKVIGPEDVDVGGGQHERLTRVELEVEAMGQKSTTWYDAEGRETRTHATVAGIRMGTRRATADEVQALRDGAPSTASPDVFAPSMVREPFFVPDARRIERATVRIRPREGTVLPALVEDDRQSRRITEDDGSAVFELRIRTPIPGRGGMRPLTDVPPEIAPCLAPSAAIQCDAPRIQELAASIVGDDHDAWRCAQKIERWVDEYISDKNFGVGFASALEVAEDRAGDCSEHAVLLAGLCRAAGIPCRVAMGLLYIGGIWGGHAWNEVWIDGAWYALDGTLGLGRADALHLALAKLTLADGDGSNEFTALMTGLGQLDIEVLEVTSGRTIAPAVAHGRIDTGRYVDAAFGITFTLPDGIDAEARRPDSSIGFDLLRVRAADPTKPRPALTLRAYDAPATGLWPEFLPTTSGTATTLDGRPALRFESGATGAKSIRVLVRADATVFEFRFADIAPEAIAPFVESTLASVDFDG